MLPPFIIEQIRQREEQARQDERPALELPVDDLRPGRPSGDGRSNGTLDKEPTVERGVVVIDL